MENSKITQDFEVKDSSVTEVSESEVPVDDSRVTPTESGSKIARFLGKSVKGAVKGAIEAKTVDVKMPVGEAIAKPVPETKVPKMDVSRPTKVSMRSVAEFAKTPHSVITPKTSKHNVAHESVRTLHIHNRVHEDKIDKAVYNRTSRKAIDISNIQALQADMSEQFE